MTLQRETRAVPEIKPISGSSFFMLMEWCDMREQRQGCLKKHHFNEPTVYEVYAS